MMKNVFYFIVLAFLVVRDTKRCEITKYGISVQIQSTGLKFCEVDVLQELHIVILVMMSP